jgi:hypothetical protein
MCIEPATGRSADARIWGIDGVGDVDIDTRIDMRNCNHISWVPTFSLPSHQHGLFGARGFSGGAG